MRLLPVVALAAALVAAPASAQLARPNAEGVLFAHVHLNVADMELHKRLWTEHFGGVVVTKGPLTVVKVPNMLIALTQRAPTGPSQGTAMDHFGFKVPSVAAFAAEWRAAGYEVQSEFTGSEGFPNAYLLAPDGVRFEIQEEATLPVKASAYHIHFWVPEAQIQPLMEWYHTNFGMVIQPRGSIQTAGDVPGMNLSFAPCPANAECGPTQGRAIDHIGFDVAGIDRFAERLKARGIVYQTENRVIDAIGLTISYLVDPAGVRIEVTEGYTLY
jgi:catechol 2,3-dioxygenase-like lactoylglutathione lyase family enzyme